MTRGVRGNAYPALATTVAAFVVSLSNHEKSLDRVNSRSPRDFDVSPYFTVVKPPPVEDFDYTRLRWAH